MRDPFHTAGHDEEHAGAARAVAAGASGPDPTWFAALVSANGSGGNRWLVAAGHASLSRPGRAGAEL